MNQKGFSRIISLILVFILFIAIVFFIFIKKNKSEQYQTYARCVEKTGLPCEFYFVGDNGHKWLPSPHRTKEECDSANQIGGHTCIIPPGNFRENRWVNSVELERAKLDKTTTQDSQVTDWKTYNNEELGYQLQYPSGWKVNAHIGGLSEVIINPTDAEDFTAYLSVLIQPKILSEQELKGVCDRSNGQFTVIDFAGTKGFQCTYNKTTNVHIEHFGKHYRVQTQKNDLEETTKAIKTFKFIK